ncbi:MAG: PfkB family carbohydrate kinase [Magnetococcus sp. DMHC-6]
MNHLTHKIVTLEQMAAKAKEFKTAGLRIVLCHGAFDLLHPGHLRHLQRARQEGDRLMVTITADAFITKGPGRPVFPEQIRAESLASLECVDYVAVIFEATALPVLRALQPDIYAKGSDYQDASKDLTNNIQLEKAEVEKQGGKLFLTNEMTFSSTTLLNEHFELFAPNTKEYLNQFRTKHTAETIIDQLRTLHGKRVLVVGETIIDEYCYSNPLGLTGKSGNILAVCCNLEEKFAGGSLAVANHLAGMAHEVTLLTGIGRFDGYEAFIRSKLAKNVLPLLHYFDSAPTLVKRRYLDPDYNKLFEVYHYDTHPLTDHVETALCHWIEKHAQEFDLVVVPDYGNGLISKSIVQALCTHARFLAVNTQINSGNRGYHVITRYPRADFVSLNEPEARLATHNRYTPIEQIANWISTTLHAPHVAITQGTQGALLLEKQNQQVHRIPALTRHVKDRIGAGDAFLAISALCLCHGMTPEEALFVGSAAAAINVQVLCNQKTTTTIELYKFITTLLK